MDAGIHELLMWVEVFLIGALLDRLVHWVASARTSPNPWDKQLEDELEAADPAALCSRCLAPHPEDASLCPYCGARHVLGVVF